MIKTMCFAMFELCTVTHPFARLPSAGFIRSVLTRQITRRTRALTKPAGLFARFLHQQEIFLTATVTQLSPLFASLLTNFVSAHLQIDAALIYHLTNIIECPTE